MARNAVMRWPLPARVAATVLLAAAAGALAALIRLPLPWLIGPLFVTASLCMAGVPLAGSTRLRNGGMGLIGVALGLYFTPAVLGTVARLVPALMAGVVWSLLLGYGFYRFLRRVDAAAADPPATAFFAGAIGGASEMALLAERHGGRVDRVAGAHSLRVLMVVASIPFALQWLGVHGADPSTLAMREVHPGGLALLLAAAAVGGLAMRRLGAPNPWVLGALAVSALLTGCGIEWSALPKPLSALGQVFIGISLGTRFSPESMRSAPRWLAAVAVGTVVMLLASAAFALLLATLLDLHIATMVLATSPGGIAEMAITASVLGLGVPVVTAFQVVRYVTVLVLMAPLYRWEARRLACAV